MAKRSKLTFHSSLPSAYKGKGAHDKAMLVHASADGGETALCNRPAPGRLSDLFCHERSEVDCLPCLLRMPKR